MIKTLRTISIVLVALLASFSTSDTLLARGGRGSGGSGRGGRGATPPSSKGGSKRNPKTSVKKIGSPTDYLEQVQREDATALRPDFLISQREESGYDASSADRAIALLRAREKESNTHPL